MTPEIRAPEPLMRAAFVLVLVLLGVSLTACNDDDNPPDTEPSATSASSASSATGDPGDPSGTYETRVALTGTTCAGIEVEDQSTVVDLAGGTVTLTHGPLTYTGTLNAQGAFTTEPVQVDVGPDTHRLAVAGSLHDERLEAVVTAHVTGGQTCDYQVSWRGSKR